MSQHKRDHVSHRKRHGHHQKRTTKFMKVYHPFMPLLLMVTGILLISSALSGKPSRQSQTVSTSGSNAPVLAFATSISNSGLLNYTNQRRTTAGVANLSINSKLNSAAQSKANDMASRNYWSHNTPDGSPPWTFITNAGYSYNKAGENLACGFDESSDVITGWFNSQSHKDNLLNTGYTEVGFGIANANSYNCGNIPATQQTIVVAMYGSPYTANTAPTPSTSSTTPKTTTTAKPATVAAPSSTATQPSSPTTIPTEHNLTLNVVDSSGKPAINLKVELHSNPRIGYTDEKGNVVFSNVESGSHTIIIEIDGAKSETPVDITGTEKNLKLSIVKPELTSNQTSRSGASNTIAKPAGVNRLQTLTDRYATQVFIFLVLAVVLGIAYIVIKHSLAAHRFFVKGERYILTHKYVDILVLLLVLALYFLTRNVANIL